MSRSSFSFVLSLTDTSAAGRLPPCVASRDSLLSPADSLCSLSLSRPERMATAPSRLSLVFFSLSIASSSALSLSRRRPPLLFVVSNLVNRQRNQIVDAVVIARILGASLVVPILQVNVIWGDESEFGDIFDLEHFKSVLANDVRVVSSLPSTHLMTRPVEGSPPLHVSHSWIRSRYLRRLNSAGILLLHGLDSRLSKDLPSDLRKLRCKRHTAQSTCSSEPREDS